MLYRLLPACGAAVTAAPAWAQVRGVEHGPGMMWDMWGGWWPGMILGWVFMILLLVGLVVAVVALVRWLGRTGGQPAGSAPPGDARRILEERFARGEIDEDEFTRRRRQLDAR